MSMNLTGDSATPPHETIESRVMRRRRELAQESLQRAMQNASDAAAGEGAQAQPVTPAEPHGAEHAAHAAQPAAAEPAPSQSVSQDLHNSDVPAWLLAEPGGADTAAAAPTHTPEPQLAEEPLASPEPAPQPQFVEDVEDTEDTAETGAEDVFKQADDEEPIMSTELAILDESTNEEYAAKVLAASLGLKYVDVDTFEVDMKAVALVGPELCRRHQVLPLTVSTHRIRLAMADPTDVIALDDVASATGLAVTPRVAAPEALQHAIDRYVRFDEQIADLSSELSESAASLAIDEASADLDDDDDDAPIVRFVNLIISQAIQDRASDIHIDPREASLLVRYRIDGVLHDQQHAPASIKDGVISRLKIMSGIDIAERRRPQDGRITVKHSKREIDLRVATLPTVWGEKIVMRILDNKASKMRLSNLDMSERNMQIFSDSFHKPHGMLLVTGPTGSGKSTTLYSTLSEIIRPEINVITVEDPVEYRMPGVAQIQVNAKAGLTFDGALRAILRSDPDVVLVGEIRDSETAQTSVEAALTGHLVLSTLHTNDAPSAVTRLIEMGIEPFLVASALDSVVAQRLARRLCKDCKIMRRPDPELLESLSFVIPGGEALVGEPNGCPRCAGTGYRGRLPLHEIMPMTEEIKRLTVARASSLEIREAALEQGMVSLREDGWRKVLAGLTSIEEVLRTSV